MYTDRSTSITLRLLVGLVTLLVAAGPVVVVGVLAARIDDFERGDEEVESVVRTMAEESAAVADWYFAAPEAALAVLLPQLGARESDSLLDADVRQLLADVLIAHRNLDGVFATRADGSFIHVAHADPEPRKGVDVIPSYRIKEIDVALDGSRVINQMWTDEDFRIIETESDIDDDYDPHGRPWFRVITDGVTTGWAEPYIFHSSGEPGITLAGARRDTAGEIELVVGIDLRLAELGRFLEARRPGPNGVATVVTSNGYEVASSAPLTAGGRAEGLMPTGDDITLYSDPNGETTVAAAHVGDNDAFVLLTTASDDDFLGDVHSQIRRDAILALALAVVSVGLFLAAAAWIWRHIHGLHRLASTDSLTGLPNRAAMQRLIEDEIESGEPAAIMILDLDEFKPVNDTYGHAIGDHLLVHVAERLQAAAGDDATVGRLGGDEFIVAAFGMLASSENSLWTSLIEAIDVPFLIDDIELCMQASGGVTYAVEWVSTEVLLHEADLALYAAKDTGGGDFVVFDGQIDLIDHGAVPDRSDEPDRTSERGHGGPPASASDSGEGDGGRSTTTQIVAPATLAESLRPFSPTEVP